MLLVPCLYLWYFRRYERRGRKVRAPRSARSTAPWERRRRLTHIVEINFEASGKLFISRYCFEKCTIFWDIWSWKLGEKNTFLGARGQGGHRRGSTPISRNKVSVPTKLFFPRSFVEKRDRFGDNLITKIDWNSETVKQKQWNSETVKHWNFRISKKFFCSIFFGPKGVRIRKKQKSEFFKIWHISSPGKPQQGPRANALGCYLIISETITFFDIRPRKEKFVGTRSGTPDIGVDPLRRPPFPLSPKNVFFPNFQLQISQKILHFSK